MNHQENTDLDNFILHRYAKAVIDEANRGSQDGREIPYQFLGAKTICQT